MNQSLKITAAVTEAKGSDFKLQELEIRAPIEDEVLVKIIATGMCHTDLIVRDQYYPV
ncbi:NAD(P)-dependent alcohol dehydrogenase, partial [Acinetobacter baumannii]|nr:NAD(P)-dependent alcohol dehydrogenase [Acinetobacter baumannii]